jgi:DNA polymerase III subunit alpha
MPQFAHLHCHTQFSLLDGAASISGMMKKAAADGMTAVALTDHGNMFGAFKFVAEADKQGLKPIVGCEFYLVQDRHRKEFSKGTRDQRFHQLLLAKNAKGYQNLSKLCSLGYIEGFYSKFPRVDKQLIERYHEGLIATSCCIGAEVPQAIIHQGPEAAEKLLQWWLNLFGDDYYIELQRHQLADIDGTGISQEDVNQTLLGFAKKYNLKVIATNDSHYIDQKDSDPHDILLCVNTGEKKATPIGDGKGFRFGFPNNQFFFKTQAEMAKLFADVPQAIDNTQDIVGKVEKLKLKRDILLPNFPLPAEFATQDDFLKHLAFKGAQRHYGSITADIEERLNFELEIIKKMGFPGYFLIVQDFIGAARGLGVAVGPGRGSAAGSVVAYCTGITNIDPIRYNLLFERFLNPERVSMPDIDVDFDDVGRQRVIDYVVDKYGKNQVAQIVTYGSMAAKMSVKDVGRVLDFPLDETNALAKLIPERPGTTLAKAYEEVPELAQIRKGDDLRAQILKSAEILEGSVRNTGLHAAGVIIAPADLTDYIPVCTAKDSDLLVTQFEGKVIEDAGMLKMDFLGLKTLTIIQDALKLIKKNHDQDIDIDHIPIDDPKTYELYQRGETVGTFQFESEGMRMYLKDLKPTNIEDLIAMNALYRPGPMQFIPNYINRKQGREKVEFPHPLLEGILGYTFGIMVYQEQIMQTAQILAGYSLGGADLLRRAMGKKDKEKMAKEKEKFVAGAKKIHDIPETKAAEIFGIMEKFAEYGFNRSHSAAYSVVAYQTGYLKANFPAEYMAAVLTHSMGDIDKISFFLEETRRMGLSVLGPDVNESEQVFGVNKKGQIRFGLGAVKGTGEAAVESIIGERDKEGPFKDIWDFASRLNLRAVNKKTFESLAYAGGFDSFPELHRAQYFHAPEGDLSGLEKIIKYGGATQAEKLSTQVSLFGGAGGGAVSKPKLPPVEPWGDLMKLKFEKEVVGFYLSGHPLDQFKAEIESFCTCSVTQIENFKGQDIKIAGIVTQTQVRTSKTGKPFALFGVEDYNGSLELALFGEDYLKNQHLLAVGQFVFLRGRVQERYGQVGTWELKVNQIQLLSDIREKMAKKLEVKIDVQQINPAMLNELQRVVQANAGNCELRISLYDRAEKVNVEAVSRRYKVQPTNDLLRQLRQMELDYRLVG